MALETWFFLSLGSAFLIALTQIFDKILTRTIDPQVLPAIKKAINGSILLLFSYFFLKFYIPTNLNLWYFVIVLAIFSLLATVLYFMAIKRDEVSRILPYQISFIILLTFAFSILLFSESFTPLKGVGAVLIAAGAYGVLTGGEIKLPENTKALWLITIAGIFLVAYELTIKAGVSSFPPYLLAIFVYYAADPLLWGYNIGRNREQIGSLRDKFDLKTTLVLLGGCLGASFSALALYFALSMGPASIVLPLAHTSPLFLVLLSGKILKEKNIESRFLASLSIVAGITLLYLL